MIKKDFFEEAPKEEEGVTLLEGLSDVRFEYFREEDPQKTRTEAWVDEWSAKEEKELPRAMRMTLTFKNGKTETEEPPFVLLSSISAQKFEVVQTVPAGLGRRAIRQRLQGQ